MKAYYGSRISPNMTETPEGYLVAHNVPVARTGYQEYLGREIGLDTDDRVKVYRDPDEVFSPKTMASFEGKSVTNDHPPVGLDAENTRDYEMGHTTNVRRGTGADSDLLLADLIIKDKRLIDAIRNGKREVSAGYECDYVPNGDGTYSQKNIIGNHVAVVDQGRAGHRVRILDRKVTDAPDDDAEEASKRYGIAVKKDGHRTPPEGYPKDREQYGDPVNYEYPIDREHIQAAVDYFQKKKDHTEGGYSDEEWSKIGKRITEAANRLLHKGYEYRDGDIVDTKHTQDSKGGIRMQIKLPTRGKARVKDVLAAAGLKIFAMDAEPEEVMEAVDALAEESREDDDEKAKSDDASKQTTDDPGDQAKLDQVLEMLKSMNERIDNLEKGKTSDEKTAEEMLDEAIAKADGGESETIEPEETHDNDAGPVMPEEDRPQSGLTGDSKRVFLQSIKPIIAAIPDEPTRRKVVDTAIASLKGRSGANVYGQMVRDTNKQVRERQQQTQQAQVIDYADLGEQIRNKYNPHYKNQQA